MLDPEASSVRGDLAWLTLEVASSKRFFICSFSSAADMNAAALGGAGDVGAESIGGGLSYDAMGAEDEDPP